MVGLLNTENYLPWLKLAERRFVWDFNTGLVVDVEVLDQVLGLVRVETCSWDN